MDTLYTLCRSVDNRVSMPVSPAEAAEILVRKKAYFTEEAKTNPLAREILMRGTISFFDLPKHDTHGFLAGPATFFRTHEILRHTRRQNSPIKIGTKEYPHNEAVDMFARCVPNVKLHHCPWCSLARYTTSVGLAWGATLLTAHLVARDTETGFFDRGVLFFMGLYSTLAAVVWTAVKQNRDIRRSAPWNCSIYLDLNADLVRRDSPLVAAARKEFMPRQQFFKTREFYYPLARKIEAQGLDTALTSHLKAAPAGAAGRPQMASERR